MSGMKVFKFDVDEDFAKQHNEMVRETKNMVLSGIALFILSIAGGIAAWIFIDPMSPWRLLASVGLILFGLMMLIVALMLPKSVGKTQALYDAHPLASVFSRRCSRFHSVLAHTRHPYTGAV